MDLISRHAVVRNEDAGGTVLGNLSGKHKQNMHGGAFLANKRDQWQRSDKTLICERLFPHGSLVEGWEVVPPGISSIVPIFKLLQLTPVKPLLLYYSLVVRPRAEDSVVGPNSHLGASIALASVICSL